MEDADGREEGECHMKPAGNIIEKESKKSE